MNQDFGLVIDWETSGLPNHEMPTTIYLEGPQGIEFGAILVKLPELEPIAEFDSRVKFVGSAHGVYYGGPLYERITWSQEAEQIHGITTTSLKDAPTPVEVSAKFVSWVGNNTGLKENQPIMICGHNPAFDLYFTRQLLFLGHTEKKVRFHHRMVDTFSLGYILYGCKSSDELFLRTSGVNRKKHRAIEDARLTLNALKAIYQSCHTA